MATITAKADGNWSSAGTWNGGVAPGNGDTADLNNHSVTQDIATIPASGTLLAIQNTGGGTLNVPGGYTINATNVSNIADNAQVLTASGAIIINGSVNNTAAAAVSGDTTLALLTAGNTIISGSVINSGNNTSGDGIAGNTTCCAVAQQVGSLAIGGSVSNSGSTAWGLESVIQDPKQTCSIGGNISNSGNGGAAIRFPQGSESNMITVGGNASNTGTNGYVTVFDSSYHGGVIDISGNWSNSTGTNGNVNTPNGNLVIIRGNCSAAITPLGYVIVLGTITGAVTLANYGVLFSYAGKLQGTFANTYGLWCCWGNPTTNASWIAAGSGGQASTIRLAPGASIFKVGLSTVQLSVDGGGGGGGYPYFDSWSPNDTPFPPSSTAS